MANGPSIVGSNGFPATVPEPDGVTPVDELIRRLGNEAEKRGENLLNSAESRFLRTGAVLAAFTVFGIWLVTPPRRT